MANSKIAGAAKTVILFLFIAAAIGVFLSAYQFQGPSSVKAANAPGAAFLNYDIRLDKAARKTIESYRRLASIATDLAIEQRTAVTSGLERLRTKIPTAQIVYDDELGNAEVIGPDPLRGPAFLDQTSAVSRPDRLRGFIRSYADIFGLSPSQVDKLTLNSDYTNPDGALSFVSLSQTIAGIPVFRGEVKAGFARTGEMLRIINDLAPDVDYKSVSSDFGDPSQAVVAASRSVGDDMSDPGAAATAKDRDDRVVFGDGESAPVADKIYFPTEPGVVVPAWRVLIWQSVNAYYVIVDARSQTVLWRKNIVDDQTQPATYSVYANPDRYLDIEHSPFPLSPATAQPGVTQGVAIPRTQVTRVGNETPYSFNQLGWVNDGSTITDGNAVQAGLDRDGTDGIDPGSEAVSATRNFTFDYHPLDPTTGIGDNPVPPTQTYPGSAFQQGAVTQLFYVCNWYHDATYLLGFNEAAGNFQNVNFGQQGLGGDRVRAEAEDSSGTSNANFATPADGDRPRMQMYIFTGSNPNIDGSLDADVVIHEHTHGLSNRLHGNSAGLFNDMSRSMGEGWSDFYAMSMLSQPSDPVGGIYTAAEYASFEISNGFLSNGYYGIRRFPTARLSAIGPNGQPHDPLTFRDIDSNQMDLSRGAFAPRFTGTSDEVHNAGEIWCSMLWEIRARFIDRLGWAAGNQKAMQIIMDGMKLAPLSPTFLTERDAIVAAAVGEGSPDDVADIWDGFASRGLGTSASIQNVGGTSIGGTGLTRVTEAFDEPDLGQNAALISTSDVYGDNDGYAEPGEFVMVSVPIANNTGKTASSVTVRIEGGGSASYGNIAGTSTVSRDIAYLIPLTAPCGGSISLTIDVTSSLGTVSFTRQIFVGKPADTSSSEGFDAVATPGFPAGWTAVSVSGGTNFVTTTSGPDTAPNTAFALDPATGGGGSDLTSPPISVISPTSAVTFRNKFDTESGWDGGVLEISISGAPYVDIVSAGGTFIQNGYNGIMGAGTNNPVGSRAGWTGSSGGYVTTIVQLPSTANGRVVQLRWRFGADNNTAVTGWNIDSVSLQGAGFVTGFACQLASNATFSLSGKVRDPLGRGLPGAAVTLSGGIGGPVRVLTSSLGFYNFDAVSAGHNYTVTATSKRFRFAARSLDLTSDVSGVDLQGIE